MRQIHVSLLVHLIIIIIQQKLNWIEYEEYVYIYHLFLRTGCWWYVGWIMSIARTFRYSYRKFGFVAKLTVNNKRGHGFHMDFCTFVSTQYWPFNGFQSLKYNWKRKKTTICLKLSHNIVHTCSYQWQIYSLLKIKSLANLCNSNLNRFFNLW